MSNNLGPYFIKKTSETTDRYIRNLEELLKCVKKNDSLVRKQVEEEYDKQIKGQKGENEIIYQLENSGMDMVILHDIFLMHDNLSAQIDFIVITRKKTYIIECKNFNCDIEITNNRDFLCHYKNQAPQRIESPIVQNDKHINVVKQLRKESLSKFDIDNRFDESIDSHYVNLVVLANNKHIIDSSNASDEDKNAIVMADQLINKIKEIDDKETKLSKTVVEMKDIGEFFNRSNKICEERYKFIFAFRDKILDEYRVESMLNLDSSISLTCPNCNKKLVMLRSNSSYENKYFLGCPNYPRCNYSKPINIDNNKKD